jgi:prohibitin 1
MAEYYQQNQEFNFRRITPVILIAAVVLILIAFGSNMTVTIEPGEKGVLFKKFSGLDKETVYDQGLKVIMPWNTMYVYNIKVQESVSNMTVLSKNGLNIKIELSYRYNPVPSQIGELHDVVGSSYHETVIIPEIRSVTREVIGKYLPEELYSSKREVIEDEIYQSTQESLQRKYINLDAVLIRDVTLPPSLQAAIENKLKQEQAALEYEFKLQRAKQEAERLKIEAEGKATAFDIINKSLTDKILKEKGIEATLKLAESPNSKVVVVGSGKDGLPLILGNQ